MARSYACKWCGDAERMNFYDSRPNDCKACMSKNQKKARKADPQKFKDKSNSWASRNREAVRQNAKRWYKANRARRLSVGKKWTASNIAHSNALQRAWRNENPEKVRAIKARRKIKDPKCFGRYDMNWRRKHPERARAKSRRSSLKFQYGITPEQFSATLAMQGGRCAICPNEISESVKRSAHQDHDHATGRLRGILCRSCNHGLGMFRDSPELLRCAIDYLSDYRPEILSA